MGTQSFFFFFFRILARDEKAVQSLCLGFALFTRGISQFVSRDLQLTDALRVIPKTQLAERPFPAFYPLYAQGSGVFLFVPLCSSECNLKSYLQENAFAVSQWVLSDETRGFDDSILEMLLLLGAVLLLWTFLDLLNFELSCSTFTNESKCKLKKGHCSLFKGGFLEAKQTQQFENLSQPFFYCLKNTIFYGFNLYTEKKAIPNIIFIFQT